MERRLPLNFIVNFCGEIRQGQGEDNWCYSFGANAGMLGVFDGCGGAGARTSAHYGGRTEAYMASRLAAGVFYESFNQAYPGSMSASAFASDVLTPNLSRRFAANVPPQDASGFQIRGSMVRTLPTTAASVLIRQERENELTVSPIWAGDSRVYILDSAGLAQLTVDDTSVPDPMENQYEDGVLKNIICQDRPVRLRVRTLRIKPPFILLAATDGCFGYVSTPMEFEGLLLETMLRAENVGQWEQLLQKTIGSFAGDDHTMCLAAFGYRDFQSIQRVFSGRYAALEKQFLEPVRQIPLEDRDTRRGLWNQYRQGYMRYLRDEANA